MSQMLRHRRNQPPGYTAAALKEIQSKADEFIALFVDAVESRGGARWWNTNFAENAHISACKTTAAAAAPRSARQRCQRNNLRSNFLAKRPYAIVELGCLQTRAGGAPG